MDISQVSEFIDNYKFLLISLAILLIIFIIKKFLMVDCLLINSLFRSLRLVKFTEFTTIIRTFKNLATFVVVMMGPNLLITTWKRLLTQQRREAKSIIF